ncbi:hypothetical protein IAT38_000205 [Cryptococcus sp. DSM 104549]
METRSLVLLPAAGWGHVRSMLQIGLNLMTESPNILLTLICQQATFKDVQAELGRQHHLTQQDKARVHCVEGEGAEGVKQAFEKLIDGEEGVREGRVPSLVIYDLFKFSLPTILKELSAQRGIPKIPCAYLFPVTAASILRLCGPLDQWGQKTGWAKRFEEYKAEGMAEEDAAKKAFVNASGQLLEPPDLPPMYDYEYDPQQAAMPFPEAYYWKLTAVETATRESDALITFGARELEEWTTKKLETTFSLPVYSLGPQLSKEAFDNNHPARRTVYSPDERKVMDFLDSVVTKWGKRRAAYISFGSVVWPHRRPEIVELLVDSLLKADPPIPFVFATLAPGAAQSVPANLRQKVLDSGMGIIVDSAPQHSVLQHEAVRFFVTHSGAGSSVEAIMAVVPVVCVPFISDQPLWAAQLARVWDCGVQLHQLNSGMDGLPLGSGGIVEGTPDAISAEMQQAWATMLDDEKWGAMREAMRKVKRVILDSGAKGESYKAKKRLVDNYLN